MQRKVYCDYLRIISIFAVVVLHVAASNWNNADVNSFEWQMFNFYDSIVRWGVPIFVMISGSLFLERDIPLKKIYSKYVLRMAIAFVAWSYFYSLMTEGTFDNGIINGLKFHLDIASMALGHYHMWFVLMIIGIYICIPFYKMIVSKEWVMKYYLIVSFIFAFLIPWVIKILNDFVAEKSDLVQETIGVINSDVYNMGMHVVLGYSFYFILGYYLDQIELDKKMRMLIYVAGILGFVITIYVDQFLAVKLQTACSNYYGNFDVNILCEAVCVHTLFKYRNYINDGLNTLIRTLSRYGFGAYLIHALFINKLDTVFGLDTLSFNAVVSVPVISAVIFALSIIVSAILNHIPIIKQYCV